jgi:hypothetical protein
MRYALGDGGPNLLWDNPSQSGASTRSRRATEDRSGGDTSSVWPQARWPRQDALARMQFDSRVISRNVVELTSQPLPQLGVQLVRHVAQAPHGNRLTVTTRLNSLRPGKSRSLRSSTPVWAAWSITRIATPTRLAIRINPATDLPGGHKGLHHEPWETVRRIGDEVLLARCPTSHAAKLGADADLVVAEMGDYLFVMKRQEDDDPQGRHLAGEAVQVYASGTAADPAPGMDFCQIEFTGRRGQRTPTLSVTWDLLPWNPSYPDNELAALVRTL